MAAVLQQQQTPTFNATHGVGGTNGLEYVHQAATADIRNRSIQSNKHEEDPEAQVDLLYAEVMLAID
jgi:hypothetical protein